jgi:uncharacterized phage-associated protein
MADVFEVAKYFIGRSMQDDEPVTHLKLQKLCYYALGVYSALENKQLFENTIEAWEHGPVVKELYSKYREHGKSPIEEAIVLGTLNLDETEQKRLSEVYNFFGQYSAWRLREMTHQENPWIEAYRHGLKTSIKYSDIKEFFKDKVTSKN